MKITDSFNTWFRYLRAVIGNPSFSLSIKTLLRATIFLGSALHRALNTSPKVPLGRSITYFIERVLGRRNKNFILFSHHLSNLGYLLILLCLLGHIGEGVLLKVPVAVCGKLGRVGISIDVS